MLKKTVSYVDFNDQKREEAFYFNLTKSELAELELSEKGGLSELIKRVVKEEDLGEIIKIFKKLVLEAYGQKSEDGRRFIKSPELKEEFAQTAAYDELFMSLATNAEEAAKFVNALIPQETRKELEKQQKINLGK